MTNDELKRDLAKFCEYMEANGTFLLAGMFSVENAKTGARVTLTAGDPDWITWSLATSVLSEKGYEVKQK